MPKISLSRDIFGPYSPLQPGTLHSPAGDYDRVSHAPVNPLSPPYTRKTGVNPAGWPLHQEIRESKALAYAAYCFYTVPSKMDESHYLQAYIGTQTNKLGQATDAIIELLNNMPEAQGQFEDAKTAALKKIETERITKSGIFWNYYSARERGLDTDVRKSIYNEVAKMEMSNLKSFFSENIAGKKFTYCVIGKRDEVDFEALKKLGEVKELTLEEIFGY